MTYTPRCPGLWRAMPTSPACVQDDGRPRRDDRDRQVHAADRRLCQVGSCDRLYPNRPRRIRPLQVRYALCVHQTSAPCVHRSRAQIGVPMRTKRADGQEALVLTDREPSPALLPWIESARNPQCREYGIGMDVMVTQVGVGSFILVPVSLLWMYVVDQIW